MKRYIGNDKDGNFIVCEWSLDDGVFRSSMDRVCRVTGEDLDFIDEVSFDFNDNFGVEFKYMVENYCDSDIPHDLIEVVNRWKEIECPPTIVESFLGTTSHSITFVTNEGDTDLYKVMIGGEEFDFEWGIGIQDKPTVVDAIIAVIKDSSYGRLGFSECCEELEDLFGDTRTVEVVAAGCVDNYNKLERIGLINEIPEDYWRN